MLTKQENSNKSMCVFLYSVCVPCVYLYTVCVYLYVLCVRAHLDHLGSFDDLPVVQNRWTVQRVVGSSHYDVGPFGIHQVPKPVRHEDLVTHQSDFSHAEAECCSLSRIPRQKYLEMISNVKYKSVQRRKRNKSSRRLNQLLFSGY